MKDSGPIRKITELIQHAAEGRMLPVLHLDPTISPAGGR
jgi:hypothetical protein